MAEELPEGKETISLKLIHAAVIERLGDILDECDDYCEMEQAVINATVFLMLLAKLTPTKQAQVMELAQARARLITEELKKEPESDDDSEDAEPIGCPS